MQTYKTEAGKARMNYVVSGGFGYVKLAWIIRS
jgi:hypothetical protein